MKFWYKRNFLPYSEAPGTRHIGTTHRHWMGPSTAEEEELRALNGRLALYVQASILYGSFWLL